MIETTQNLRWSNPIYKFEINWRTSLIILSVSSMFKIVSACNPIILFNWISKCNLIYWYDSKEYPGDKKVYFRGFCLIIYV